MLGTEPKSHFFPVVAICMLEGVEFEEMVFAPTSGASLALHFLAHVIKSIITMHSSSPYYKAPHSFSNTLRIIR